MKRFLSVTLQKKDYDKEYEQWYQKLPTIQRKEEEDEEEGEYEIVDQMMDIEELPVDVADWCNVRLPYIERPLSPYSSVEEYIYWHFGKAKKVVGIYPITYLCETAKYSYDFRMAFGWNDAYVFIREGTMENDEVNVR